MTVDLAKIEALTALLAQEMTGDDFDRDAARHLACEIRRDFPAIRDSMDMVLTRLAERRH